MTNQRKNAAKPEGQRPDGIPDPDDKPEGQRPDGIPDPDDKPHLDSGVDPDNVTFNGVSLLNTKDDDWDIPSLSFPVIDEHGVAAVPGTPAAPAVTAPAAPAAIPAAMPTPTAEPHHGAPAPASAAPVPQSPASVPPAPTTPVDATQTMPAPPAFPADSGSETTVLPPLNVNVPVPGRPGATGTSRIIDDSPVSAPGAIDLGESPDEAGTAFDNLEDVSDAPTEEEYGSGMFGAGSDDDGPHAGHDGDGTDGAGATHALGRKPLIIGIAAAVLVVAAVGGFIAFRNHQRQAAYDTALSSCQAAADSVSGANDTLAAALKKADTASALGVDQVDDATTISKLKSVMSDATGTDKASTCDASLSAAELTSRAEENTKLAGTLDDHATKVESAVKAVTDSQAKKTEAEVKTVKDSLQSAVDEAKTLMTNSEGAVADDSTRQMLQSAIDAAEKLIKESSPKLADLNSALSAIQSATSDVNDSMSSYTYSRRRYSYSNSDADGSDSNGTSGSNNGYNRGNYSTGGDRTWSGSTSSGTGSGTGSGNTNNSQPNSTQPNTTPNTPGNNNTNDEGNSNTNSPSVQ